MFIHKNFRKIASIVDGKGNLVESAVIGRAVHLAGLSGTLIFKFGDGSHFTVQNQVVFAQSVYGKPFVRFPLTFHNVVLPDGKKMHPSEKGTNAEFLGKGN